MTANEVESRRRTCPLCEAMCGLTLEVSGDRVLAVRGDAEDAFSRGYICPKAVGLMDVHHDSDRVREPLIRRNGIWEGCQRFCVSAWPGVDVRPGRVGRGI